MRISEKKPFRYEYIYQNIKQEILEGKYHIGELLPSEKEITLQFGVERTTVRRSLDLLVSEGFVKKEAGVGTRVIKDSEMLFSGQNFPARNCIGFFTMNDGVYNNRSEQPYYSDLFYELELQCKNSGYQAVYYTIENEEDFKSAVLDDKFVGIIFVSSVPDNYVDFVLEHNIPMVLINRYYSKTTCVMCNHYIGATLVMNHLCDMGHREIGIIRGGRGYISDDEKMAGCLNAAFECGIEINRNMVIRGNWDFKGGYEAAQQIFNKEHHPTAVFCFNDIMALGAIKALRELGYSVGKNVSVVGFDNMRQLQFSEPDLTTVDCNRGRVAHLAIGHVISLANGGMDLPGTVLAPVKLIEGKTVCRI